MSVSPAMAEGLAATIRALYGDAEVILLERIAKALGQGIDAPDWAERKLAELQLVMARARGDLNRLTPRAVEEIVQAVIKAWNRGAATATADAQASRDLVAAVADGANPAGLPAVQQLAAETASTVVASHRSILRSTEDIYRQTIARTAPQVLLGTQTRREATQTALDSFAAKGVSGFTDKAGRRWGMDSYSEMATRTATGHAAIDGHVDRLERLGQDLVIVSDSPRECPLCFVPGTVVEGPVPTGATRSEYTGDVVSITTASGNHLTGTPHHPVLTAKGWVPLKELQPSDKVVSYRREHGLPGVMPDDVQMPSRIEEVGESGLPLLLAGPTRRDLDEDVSYRKVSGPALDLLLSAELDPAFSEPVSDLDLVSRVRPSLGGLAFSRRDSRGFGPEASSVRLMHGVKPSGAILRSGIAPSLDETVVRHRRPFVRGKACHVGLDRMVSGASIHSRSAQVVTHGASTDAECCTHRLGVLAGEVQRHQFGDLFIGQCSGNMADCGIDSSPRKGVLELGLADVESGHELLGRLASVVALDEIIDVSIGQYSGHVWDLSTGPRWFVANSIVVHNCAPWERKVLSLSGAPHVGEDVEVAGTLDEARAAGLMHPACTHSISAFFPGVTKIKPADNDPDGYAAKQRQRQIERHIREWRRRKAVALDDAAAARADAKIKTWRAEARKNVRETGTKRLSAREQIGKAH